MTRGELLERVAAEQQYWERRRRRGLSQADQAAEREFRRIMHAYLNLNTALDDVIGRIEGRRSGAGTYWNTRPVDDAQVIPDGDDGRV